MKNFNYLALILIALAIFNFKPNSAFGAFGIDEKIKQVKTTDNPAIYYLDHKRGAKKAYVNEKAFLVYGNKWSDVKVITKEQLNKWPDLKLVKSQDSPAVYFISKGKKVNIQTEDDFKKLGYRWDEIAAINKEDLDQYALASYNELGLNVNNDEYELVKLKNLPAIFYVKNKNKTAIKSAADFERLGFEWDDIVVIEKDDLENLKEIDYDAIGFNSILNSKAKLAIALDTVSPKGATTLPIGTNGNLVGVYSFDSRDGATQITGLDFTFTGMFSDQLLEDLRLTDESRIDYGSLVSRSGKNMRFNFINNPIIVGSGRIKKVYVWLDLSSCAECNKINLQLSLNKVKIDESQAQILSVLPINAKSFNLVDGSSVLAQADLNEVALENANLQAVIGQGGQTIMNFKIKETTGNEDIYVNDLTLQMDGSLSQDQIANFILKDDKKKVIARASFIDGKRLSFSLDKYKINRKTEVSFSVVADITDGEGREFDLKLGRADIVGATHGFGVKVKYANIIESVKIIRKDIGIISKSLIANKYVFAQKKGSLLGVFEIRNASEEIYLDSVKLSLTRSSGAPEPDKDVHLVNYASGEVLDTRDGSVLSSGQTEFKVNDLPLKSNAVLTLAVIAEMPKIEKSGLTYQIITNTVKYRTKSNQIIETRAPVEGNLFTAVTSNIFTYSNPEFNPNYAKGQTNIKIASFYIEASADDKVNISSFTFDKGEALQDLNHNNGFLNVKVYIGSKRLTTIEKPDRSSLTINTAYKLSAGKRIELSVYADTQKDLKVDKISLKLTGISAESYVSGLSSSVSGIDAVSNPASFTKLSAKIDTVSNGKIILDSKSNIIATYKIKNENKEDLVLNYITIASSGSGLSYGSGFSNLKLFNNTTKKTFGSTVGKPVAGSNRIRAGYTLKPNQELIFSVQVDAAKAVSEKNFKVYLNKIEATGRVSKISADIAGVPTAEMNISAE